MEGKKIQIPTAVDVNGDDATTLALPEGAVARLGRGCVPDITFSPDERYLAVGTWVGLWLYDVETLFPIALWETERGMVGRIAFSPNGKWIATSNSDHVLKVLDIQNGTCLRQVETDNYITGLTFSPDNHYLAAAYASSSTVEVWRLETGEPEGQYYTDTEIAGFYRPISISPDSQLIASTCSSETRHNADEIVVWEVGKEQQIVSLNEHLSRVSTLCFSPCGQFLASGGEDGTVYVWEVDTWQKAQEYTDFGDVSRIIPSYTPDGILRAAIVHYDETGPATISVCDLNSGEQLYTDQVWGNNVQFSGKSAWGNAVVLSNGSQLAYECRHEFINVWTPEYPYKRQFTHSPISFPTSAAFSHNGKTLAVEHHHEGVVLWDIESKRSRPAINVESAGKNQFVHKTVIGKLYAASIIEDTVTLWEADGDGTPLIEGTGRKYWSAFPALAPTGTLFAYAGEDGNIKVWNVHSRTKLYELAHPLEPDEEDDENEDDKIDKLEFGCNGKLLASETLYSDVKKLWDLEQGKEIEAFPNDQVGGIIGFTPCGQFLACHGQEILFWDIKNHELHRSGLSEGPYGFIEFSPCGQYMACNGDGNILYVYDLTRFEIHQQIRLSKDAETLYAATFSSYGRYLAAGTWWREGMEKMVICVWEVETGKQIVTFRGHPTDVHALAFSPDNKLLASASYDGSVLLWDLTPYIINDCGS